VPAAPTAGLAATILAFTDANRSGQPEPGARGPTGVAVFHDANDSTVLDPGERQATTGADGRATLSDRVAGTARIRALPTPARWPRLVGGRHHTCVGHDPGSPGRDGRRV
jgi:hypothetical protein